MMLWEGIPLTVTFLLFVGMCIYWYRRVKGTTEVKYEADTFRAPINAALSVSGFILPLLCGAIGYLSLQFVPPVQLVPLVAICALLGFSVMVGLWNMFSMTAGQSTAISITAKQLTFFVPQFVAQLCLLFCGIIVLLIYVFFFFDLPKTAAPSLADPKTAILLVRPPIRAGIDATSILAAWGSPASVTKTNQGTEWHYFSTKTEFIVLLDDNAAVSVTERKVK